MRFNHREVALAMPDKPLRLHSEGELVDDDESEPVGRDEPSRAFILNASLISPSDTRHGVPSIEERPRHGVLLLVELDDEPQSRPVAIDREPHTCRETR